MTVRIDWHGGLWRVWNLDGQMIYEVPRLVCKVPTEFVNINETGQRGYAVATGAICQIEDCVLIG